ncbi:PKD domain-containing protein [Kitasatospora sp. McL0602]|uniref:PKD domain-containing protein n=1 Tax=Kitasatospora sp. McL0602 TaxID=3439530 RepID=UPI003F892849
MSHARRRRNLAAAVVVASTGLAGVGWSLPAVAATASTLYVDSGSHACSDTGPGTEAQPFCTIQAGADAAKPGQTVLVGTGHGGYSAPVHLTHSGEPGKPIVIKGVPSGDSPRVFVGPSYAGGGSVPAHIFELSHVHDVTLQNFATGASSQEAVLVSDSARVVIDSDGVNAISKSGSSPAVRLTGTTSDTTLSRSRIDGGGGGGLVVDKGVSGTVVTTNHIFGYMADAVRVQDAPGTVITSNTVTAVESAVIALAGDSGKATVENNLVVAREDTGTPGPAIGLSVSAGSVAGTKADYNSFHTDGESLAYSWNSKQYQRQPDFTAATTQGAHDVLGIPSADSAPGPEAVVGVTDAADSSAPGELDTDINGRPRADDPQVADTGTGYFDRGAEELQAYSGLDVQVDKNLGPYPLKTTASATVSQNWPGTTTYTFDFGDGSTPVVSTSPKAEHTYLTKGQFTVTVTARGTSAGAVISTQSDVVTVNEPGDLVPDLKIGPAPRTYDLGLLAYSFDYGGSTSPYRLNGSSVDYGDGNEGNSVWIGSVRYHAYQRPGDYTVTLRLTDEGGRLATLTKTVHVAYGAQGFTPVKPTRLLDTRLPNTTGITRLGPGESIDVHIPGKSVGREYPDAAVLNVTAVNGSQGGYLSVYPKGTPRPATSNVNFTAGQVVPNLVTVPTGMKDDVTIYNFSGTTDVVVDWMGTYQVGSGDRFTALAPSRLLDTRHTAALGPDATTSVQVRGVGGVPADATSVVLNLTSTDADAGGYLTAYASGTERPGTSNLNFAARQTVANQVVVPIGADGKVSIYNKFGHTQVVADVFGYYSPTGSSLFTPVAPTRLVDTRTAGQHALGQGGTLPVATHVPAGATGAVLNVTSTASTAGGYLTVWADGAAKPGTSNLNFAAGKTVPNHVTTPLGANGSFDVYNFLGQTQVVADLFGYFTK